MLELMEASSLYFLFNIYQLDLNCSEYYLYPFCISVPYGAGIGTGVGPGPATLPGAKPLKTPGVCVYVCACVRACAHAFLL